MISDIPGTTRMAVGAFYRRVSEGGRPGAAASGLVACAAGVRVAGVRVFWSTWAATGLILLVGTSLEPLLPWHWLSLPCLVLCGALAAPWQIYRARGLRERALATLGGLTPQERLEAVLDASALLPDENVALDAAELRGLLGEELVREVSLLTPALYAELAPERREVLWSTRWLGAELRLTRGKSRLSLSSPELVSALISAAGRVGGEGARLFLRLAATQGSGSEIAHQLKHRALDQIRLVQIGAVDGCCSGPRQREDAARAARSAKRAARNARLSGRRQARLVTRRPAVSSLAA